MNDSSNTGRFSAITFHTGNHANTCHLVIVIFILNVLPAPTSNAQWFRSAEFARIKPTNIDTISIKIPLPSSAIFSSTNRFAAITSRHAAHSSADPRAMSKKRQRSASVNLPLPSAMFNGIDVDARSKGSSSHQPQIVSSIVLDL